MKPIDVEMVEKNFFKRGNPLKKLLKVSLELFDARQTGILYGTNHSKIRFLPTSMWDRGIMDKFDGKGLKGLILKMFGPGIVSARRLSPVFFFKTGQKGERKDNDGIISHVLRNFADYYKKGISVIICPDTDKYVYVEKSEKKYQQVPFFSYNGNFVKKPGKGIKLDTRIVSHFGSSNSIYIYLPDYGILVINTANLDLLEIKGSKFVRKKELKKRLDVLIKLVEASSLAYLGQLTGKKGARLLWRKEKHLRKTSMELIENEKKYRDLYENAPIAYISMNPKGDILKYNQKAKILFGYGKDDFTGGNAVNFFFERPGGDKIFSGILGSLGSGEVIKDMELRIKPDNKIPVWVSLSIEAVKDKSGKIEELRAMIMDISQRKGLEKQLFQAQKMEAIGTLAGGIAHDFNNILSPISGYAEMLLMDTAKDNPDTKYLDVILDCVKHAKELVNQILTFSRQKEHELKLLNPVDAIRDSMILVRSFLPATIKVNVNIDKTCGYILGDPVQIHQIIMNLVTNAYHAMGETGGILDISLREEKNTGQVDSKLIGEPANFVRLAVEDTGIGIDNDIYDKIFDPYFSTKEEGRGSGIGLSVVQGIVKSHKGHIFVKSEKEKGTRFDIFFPVCREYKGVEMAEPEDMPVKTGTERVLLVDDDKKVAAMETCMLEKLGYAVTCFTGSLNAFNVFKTNPDMFDVIMTDMTMPDLTGIELACKIYDINPDVPVILCTGHGAFIQKNNLDPVSIKKILKKPVALKELSYFLRQVLDT
ncbi:MAG: response regulator [Deltaproteobacteria bacterium]|nr:response regulator [Deltaproteobacteria bacterium]